jgi:hypothetical protein
MSSEGRARARPNRAVIKRQRVMGRQKRAKHADASVSPASCKIEPQIKLYVVNRGIDLIVERLIDAGVTNKDLWADLPLPFVPTMRSKSTADKKRERYLVYLDCRKRLLEQKNPDGSPRRKRITNRALLLAAEECGVSKQTIIDAVRDYESGYLRPDVP